MVGVLGSLETRFFALVQMRDLARVCTGELTRLMGITPIQERELLSRLARRKLIVRVRRGLYLAPLRFPPGGQWSPGESLALNTLMEDRGARYQICGPNAFHRYGWTGQVPNRLYVYNDRVSGRRRVGPTSLTCIKVNKRRLGDTETVRTPGGDLVYSSRARALVDAVEDWSRFETLPRAYDWIRDELRRDKSLAGEIVRSAVRCSNVGTARRLGVLLESEGAPRRLLRKLGAAIPDSSSLIPWVPGRVKQGSIDRRWGVIRNDAR